MVDAIDELIRSCLSSLIQDVRNGKWKGRRERELISLFCFGHLLRFCRPGFFLRDPTQIGIEVPVPQISAQRSLTGKSANKRQVCKDVVIWAEPGMTCWDSAAQPTVRPACIIEWKHNEVSDYDVRWLRHFSAVCRPFVGYAVHTKQEAQGQFALSCARIYMGEDKPGWFESK